jgi:hypothetical protein
MVEDRGGKMLVLLITQNYFHGYRKPYPYIAPFLRPRIDEIVNGRNVLTLAKEYCAENQFDCIDTISLLNKDDFFTIDAHWNKFGHAKVGQLLSVYIKGHYRP